MKFEKMDKDYMQSAFQSFNGGFCEFKVLEAESKVSRSNNDMIKIKLECNNFEHQTSVVYDYLVSTVKWKLATFLVSTNQQDLGEKGEISHSQLIGSSGYCFCIKEKESSFFKIKRYLTKEEFDKERKNISQSMRNDPITNNFDDDIPF